MPYRNDLQFRRVAALGFWTILTGAEIEALHQMNLDAPTLPVTAALPLTVPSTSLTALVRPPLLTSTLLSAVLISFGSQRYTPKTTSDFGDEYDYIIVGGGTAGSVVASRLSEVACVSVLLLEAGKSPPSWSEIPAMAKFLENTEFDWAYKTEPQNYAARANIKQQLNCHSGKTVGGTSVINNMFYTRGNRQNYDNWATSGAQGWSYNDVKPYFIKAEDNQRASYFASGFHGKGGPLTVQRPRYKPEIKAPFMKAAKSLGYDFVDVNAARQTGFFDIQATIRGGNRCSTGKAYLVPAENRTNLDIVQSARVLKVNIRNRRAVGVQVDYMNQTRVVRARREVILSANTFNTAQLLMLSGIGPKKHLKKHNIPLVADLPVGQNLHDHAYSAIFYEITNPTVQPITIKSATSAKQYMAKRTGPLTSPIFAFSIAFLKDNKTHPADDLPNYKLYLAEASVDVLQMYGVKPDVYTKTFAPYAGKPMLACASQTVQPRSRGTVTLQSSDPYDAPIINPNYFKDPQDAKDVVTGLKNCIRLCTSPPMTKFGVQPMKTLMSGCEKYRRDSDGYLDCYARSFTVPANYHVGTVKMGDSNDPTTVVDSQLRVKTIQGLRVVDRSVMPIIPSGDIYASAVMVGEKASDIIKSTIDCDC